MNRVVVDLSVFGTLIEGRVVGEDENHMITTKHGHGDNMHI